MNFNLENIVTNLVSQLSFIILLIMVVRAIVAYTREDWGAFVSGLLLGVCCLIIALFGPQLEDFARAVGNAIFG